MRLDVSCVIRQIWWRSYSAYLLGSADGSSINGGAHILPNIIQPLSFRARINLDFSCQSPETNLSTQNVQVHREYCEMAYYRYIDLAESCRRMTIVKIVLCSLIYNHCTLFKFHETQKRHGYKWKLFIETKKEH